MNCKQKIKAILLVPRSRRYLKTICDELERCDYKELITNPKTHGFRQTELHTIVKSYFWAARTLSNCDCLPRSIALYHHLKSQNYNVEHKFGVNNKGTQFNAHAWVEHQKKPLNEPQDLYQRFTVLR